MLKKPDDWPRLVWRSDWLIWFRPRRAKAMRRLAMRWRRQDNVEWVCT